MTEEEWLKAIDPTSMLESLRSKAGDRKLRLFAVACCRELGERIGDERLRRAVEVAERYADGRVTAEELRKADELVAAVKPDRDSGDDSPLAPVEKAACWVASASAFDAAENALGYCSRADFDLPFRILLWRRQKRRMRGFQVQAIRDIFGNPFRLVAADPVWGTSDVLALAAGIYADRAFDRLPILADALMDAGCSQDDLLNHLRSDGPHVRGCWALDLVLGKA